MKKFKLFFSSIVLVAVLAGCAAGCHSTLEQGGAYNPSVTNDAGVVTAAAQPETVLEITDSAYKFAYSTALNGLKFERDNRAEIDKVAPQVKPALDKIRATVWDIDQRWAKARKAYKEHPTPAGLTTLQTILGEVERILPAVEDELAPYFESLTK